MMDVLNSNGLSSDQLGNPQNSCRLSEENFTNEVIWELHKFTNGEKQRLSEWIAQISPCEHLFINVKKSTLNI